MNKTATSEATQQPAEPEWVYSHHAVAFLDIMGQQSVFEDFPGVPNDVATKAILMEKLRHTVGYIPVLRKGFSDMFDSMRGDRVIPAQVPKEFHAEFRRMQQTEIHLQGLSDAIIAWSPINTVDEPTLARAMNGLWGIMMTTAGMNLTALATKHALRGGIDVDGGIPIEPGGNEIYGPALNCAYVLESKFARSPRILIGKGLLAFLESIESDLTSSQYIDYAKKLTERCRQLIIEDEDGHPILHFLGPGAREVMQVPGYRKAALDPAFAFVKEATARFKDDSKLGPRYALLLRYFEKHLPDWGKEE